MKLRNKKTGQIVEKYPDRFVINSGEQIRQYNSLAELNEDWEDYEEPKDTNYWCIDSLGKIEFHSTVLDEIDGTPNNAMIRKIIGNYFDTREEAGQAVEKLKAWRRLKDKGFKSFSSNICGDDFVVTFKLTNHADYGQSMDDFDCVFDFGGGE